MKRVSIFVPVVIFATGSCAGDGAGTAGGPAATDASIEANALPLGGAGMAGSGAGGAGGSADAASGGPLPQGRDGGADSAGGGMGGAPGGCGSGYDFGKVTAHMQAAVDARKVPGIGLILVDRCGTLYKNAVGNRTVDTASLIASATKLTSGTTMMTLVDAGLVKLDDRIDKHLPYFTDAKGAITVAQLLAQTHGMPEGHACIPPPGRENGMTLAACVEQIARDVVPKRAPNTACEYDPAVSYHIMGRIAEVVTGESWETVWRKRVGDPLMMAKSTYGAVRNPRVGGGMSTTLEDYAHLVQMHLRRGEWNGRRVLSEWAVDEMQKDRCAGLPWLNTIPGEVGYGLTWWIDTKDGAGASDRISVGGAYGALPWIKHARQYAGFWLVFDQLARSRPVWIEALPLIDAALAAAKP